MGKLKLLIAIVVIATVVNYLNDPLPEGLPGFWMSKIWLGFFRMSFLLQTVATTFGFDEAAALESGSGLVAKLFQGPVPEDVVRTETNFNGIPVEVYRPPFNELTGRGLLYFHGGGWVVGHVEFYTDQLYRTAKELGAVVVYVDYRRAPKHPFPAAAEDCISAYKYFVDNAKEFKVDPTRIGVMGDSAGGNLAAVVSLATLQSGFTPKPKLQVLIFPVLQGSHLHTPSYTACRDGPMLTSGAMAFFFASYIFGEDYKQHVSTILDNKHTSPEEKKRNAMDHLTLEALPKDNFVADYKDNLDVGDSKLWEEIKDKFRDPLFAPIYAENLTGLTPAYINTCQYDVLRDDGFYYAKRLRDAEVKVTHDNILCFHAWTYVAHYIQEYYNEYTKMINYMKENI